ncbi:MAG: hypothetical protein JXA73_19475 [Acidobacteria bacterium]|nr:hypothetical protein [Acidobacteriota bacterium]
MRCRKNEIIRLPAEITALGVLILFGFFLSGASLYGADQLLKEYIYLDGRLLAIERQPTPAFAQNFSTIEDKDFRAGVPVDDDFPFIQAYMPGMSFSHSQKSSAESATLEQGRESRHLQQSNPQIERRIP